MRTSAMMPLSLSSNSPRYFAPAIMEGISTVTMRLPFKVSGTLPSAMRWQRPSTTAVLPTPGSPMRQGLFFPRRDRMRMTRSVSFSRPMMGSSLPPSAMAVRSRPYFDRVGAPWMRDSPLVSRSLSRRPSRLSSLVPAWRLPPESRPRDSPLSACEVLLRNPATSRRSSSGDTATASRSRTATQSGCSRSANSRCSVPT